MVFLPFRNLMERLGKKKGIFEEMKIIALDIKQ